MGSRTNPFAAAMQPFVKILRPLVIFATTLQAVVPRCVGEVGIRRRQKDAGSPDDDADHLADGEGAQVPEVRVAGQTSVDAESDQRVDRRQLTDVSGDVRRLAAETARRALYRPTSSHTQTNNKGIRLGDSRYDITPRQLTFYFLVRWTVKCRKHRKGHMAPPSRITMGADHPEKWAE